MAVLFGLALLATGAGMAGATSRVAAEGARDKGAFQERRLPVPLPVVPGATLKPVAFKDLQGWREDDASAAFATFLKSCVAFKAPPKEVGPPSAPTFRGGLLHACIAAKAIARALGTAAPTPEVARLFFEANFRPLRIVPDKAAPGAPGGFLTGYYEPELQGSPVRTEEFTVPVYGRPGDLIPLAGSPTANHGGAVREENGVRVPYYDRTAIEEGALAGRGLEICWLKEPVDLFFMQIQGSGRVRLPSGHVLRLNYDGYNGHPYTPVGRILIEKGIVPKEEMSMDRIRAYVTADPAAGRELMRANKSFVFFKALDLPDDAGAMGAQGIPLTAGRSIAVDRRLHTYGTPFFIEADLPLSAPGGAEPFRRLMIAQDTGSAIVGPARADLYFGAGAEAGAVAGRIRHPGAFTLLLPRLADVAAAEAMKAGEGPSS